MLQIYLIDTGVVVQFIQYIAKQFFNIFLLFCTRTQSSKSRNLNTSLSPRSNKIVVIKKNCLYHYFLKQNVFKRKIVSLLSCFKIEIECRKNTLRKMQLNKSFKKRRPHDVNYRRFFFLKIYNICNLGNASSTFFAQKC